MFHVEGVSKLFHVEGVSKCFMWRGLTAVSCGGVSKCFT